MVTLAGWHTDPPYISTFLSFWSSWKGGVELRKVGRRARGPTRVHSGFGMSFSGKTLLKTGRCLWGKARLTGTRGLSTRTLFRPVESQNLQNNRIVAGRLPGFLQSGNVHRADGLLKI
jgi:hypothetical protein